MKKEFSRGFEPRRLLIMIVGNIFLGLGVSIFKLSGLGNDPFSGMAMAVSAGIGISYAHFAVLLNIVLFVIELLFGRHYIGAGTLVNAVGLAYIVTFFYNLTLSFMAPPTILWQRIVTVCVGVIVTSFGLALYQAPNAGVAPYDSLSLIMHERCPKITYFWHRITTDAICALVCFLFGGIIGLGTLVSAFGLGPFVQFFTIHVANRLLPPDAPEA
jgi:uncharacterized membrane protein YczE